MTKISLIAAVDENYGLGKNNQLLCHLPADLSYFKKNTLGKPVIMGRKTFQSIGRPLPGRHNIILSRTMVPATGISIAHSLSEAIVIAGNVEEVMIIGGAEIFQQALSLAEQIYLTVIHHKFEADTFFPPFNETGWQCIYKEEHAQDEKNHYNLTFYRYQRKK
ncbi:dihydrofolate reductase [Legionella dresdenensis]|uniref:Dihydrofolate reductase n=1 Tax=Legionella dresdenensis TaxID=450200 RepID=A0ABV8CFQ2_9GAMM